VDPHPSQLNRVRDTTSRKAQLRNKLKIGFAFDLKLSRPVLVCFPVSELLSSDQFEALSLAAQTSFLDEQLLILHRPDSIPLFCKQGDAGNSSKVAQPAYAI
jgi:hypothetical protein